MECRGREHVDEALASVFEDPRGTLTLVSFDALPFVPERVYVLHAIPAGARRGGHAARTQHRFLVGLAGRASVTLDDGRRTRCLALGAAGTIHVEPGTWHEIEAHGEGLAIMVLADGAYDETDYVTDRAQMPLTAATASQTAAV